MDHNQKGCISDITEEEKTMLDGSAKGVIEFLWKIIDDIDTASDMAKGDDEWYRKRVEHLQSKRWHSGITTDGYDLDIGAALKENGV